MSASSPSAFYFLQILRVLIAVVPIGLILFATFIPHQSSLRLTWLRVVTAVWLLVALVSRSALSSSVLHHYMSGTLPNGEAAARQMRIYLSTTFALFTAEQVMFVIFSIALFFVLPSALRSNQP